MDDKKQRIIIGLTGGIASGKSEVRKILESMGFFGIDADQISHEIMQNGSPVFHAIVARFGKKILDLPDDPEHASISRTHLSELVFSDKEALQWLESVSHPYIIARIKALIEQTDQSIVIEAIKLMTTDLATLCGQKWFIVTDEETQIHRLVEKRGLSYQSAQLRVAAQNSIVWNLEEFDAIIHANVPLPELRSKVIFLLEKYNASLHPDDSQNVSAIRNLDQSSE